MTRRGALGLLGAVLWLALAGRAAAQPVTGRATVPSPAGDVSILADRIEYVGPENLLTATGNVEISRGTARLLADRVQVNRDTGEAVAEGRVIFYDGDDRLAAERIEYNFGTGTGVVHGGEARVAPYYRLSGERMERVGESVYQVRRGIFTTCEDDPPTWSFRAGSATADLEDFVYGTDASFWVKSVPLIPWFPFFAAAIRRERQTGFLFPRLGTSSRKGFFTEVPFFWAISDSQDATIAVDMFERRGVGLNGEYRYVLSEEQRGRVSAFVLRETQRDDEHRAAGGLRHDWQIAPGLSFRADLNGVSDDRLLREYGDVLHQRRAQRVESNLFLTRTWENWNLVASGFWYQDLTEQRPVELQRVPDLRLEGAPQPLPGLPGFLYRMEASAIRFIREVGAEGTRVDVHPRMMRPLSAAGFFTVTPFLGGRVTAYDRTSAGTRLTRGGQTIEETENDERVRRFLELGSDVESRLSRVYPIGRWGLDSVLHSLEPRVNYTWITGQAHGRLPLWTEEVDRIPESSRVEYSVTNRVRGRTPAGAGGEAVRWELVRFLLGHAWDVKNERFGDIKGDLIVQPNGFLRFRGDLAYNPDADRRRELREGVQTATTDLAVNIDPVTVGAGTRYNERDRVSFLQGHLGARLSRNVGVRSAVNWDLRSQDVVEGRLGLDLRFDCWAFALEYIGRERDEDEFRFTLNLLGLGTPLRTSVGAGDTGVEGR